MSEIKDEVRKQFYQIYDQLDFSSDYTKSVTNLVNWLIGVPSAIIILIISNIGNFTNDGVLFANGFIITIIIATSLIILFFGYYKFKAMSHKVNFEYLQADTKTELEKRINKISKLKDKVASGVELDVEEELEEFTTFTRKLMKDRWKMETKIYKLTQFYNKFLAIVIIPPLAFISYVIFFLLS